MQKLTILYNQFSRSRFWELFSPNTITFGFWLATASFSFFIYQSIMPYRLGTLMEWTKGILSAAFLVFGLICVGIILYLGITWILKIRITKKQTPQELLGILNSNKSVIEQQIREIENRIKEAENERNSKSK